VKVSVVIPLYNKARHVRRAIDSVLAQTHQDFELIVVDDGSTDRSGEVVRLVADQRVRLITQENAGECAARNRGICEARYDLIGLLDADDAWSPDFLAAALALRARFPQAAIWATGYCHSVNGCIRLNRFHERHEASDSNGFLLDYFGPDGDWMAISSSSVLIRKDALCAVGGFPAGVIRGGDVSTWFRLALRFPIAWLPRCTATVFDDADNRTAHYCFIGNWPHFQSARDYLKEAGPDAILPEKVYRWLAMLHTLLLKRNWLANYRTELREIVRDCKSIHGFRLKCYFWYLMSWIPHPLVVLAWRLRSFFMGRGGRVTPHLFRGIRPEDREHNKADAEKLTC
jgi:glycosyltransferase involved in cell wall biosynthesis